MSMSALRPPILVADQSGLERMAQQLQQKRLIALDTESDSLYSYYPKVCLIQISVYKDSEGSPVADYLVDPLALSDVKLVGDVVTQPGCEVVMHAAENDLLLLQREYGITIQRVFDTQLAARVLGRKSVGLAAMLEEEFGVQADKRMQRTDWGVRPLTKEQILYAQKDTHYLLPLRLKLIDALKAARRWTEAQEAFVQLAAVDYESKEPPERSMWQMKEARSVDRENLGVLEALWEWREGEAQRRNTPPFKVLRNQSLAELAEVQPESLQEFRMTPSVAKTSVERYGKQLLNVINEGRQRPIPGLPENNHRPAQNLDRRILALYDKLRQWRTQTAEERGVAPDIVMSNETLMELAKRKPASLKEIEALDDIGPWKANAYAQAILAIIGADVK